MKRGAPFLAAALSAAVLAGCGSPPPEERVPEPAPAGEIPAVPSTDPFHEEARRLLAGGNVEGAMLALRDALAREPLDPFAHTVLGALEFRGGNPNPAGRHFVEALKSRPGDCMLALALAAARRRVDTAAGSEGVLRDILAHHGCPSVAYGLAAERLARHADPAVAGARLPEGGPAETAFAEVRILELEPERPGFAELADAAHGFFRGNLTVLGDQFADVSEFVRLDGHWVSSDTAVLFAGVAPGVNRIPDAASLTSALDAMVQTWRDGLARVEDYAAWDVVHWSTFRDFRGRFRGDMPDRWYANLFQSGTESLYTFCPVEIAEPGAEPVRSGRVPAFDLRVTARTAPEPPPWSDEAVEAMILQISRHFAGADHATESMVEFVGDESTGAPPGVLIKRTFVIGEAAYRIAAAEIAGPRHIYRFSFAGPAEKFDHIENDFWRVVRSLRPIEADATNPGQE